jgi:hypothetical protein
MNGMNISQRVLHPVLPVLLEIPWRTIIHKTIHGIMSAINQSITYNTHIPFFQDAFTVEYIFTTGSQESQAYFSQSFLFIIYKPQASKRKKIIQSILEIPAI